MGKSILEHVISSCLQMFPNDSVYVATSVNKENDPIEDLCANLKVNVERGNEINVASRYLSILDKNTLCDYFFRICGDTPLYDYRIMQEGLEIISNKNSDYDIVTSLPNKGFPQGQNLELLSSKLFKSRYNYFSTKRHFEHVTSFFYENINFFNHKFINFQMPGYYYEKYKYSIDTEDDLKRINSVFSYCIKPHYEYNLEEKCEIYNRILGDPFC